MPSSWNGFTYPSVTERDVEREIYLTSVGRIAYAPGQSYPAPGHPRRYQFKRGGARRLNDFAVVWIEQGRGHVESDATGRRPFPANSALILPPGAAHHYEPDSKTGWVERWICANGAYLHRLRTEGVFPSRPTLRILTQWAMLNDEFDRLGALAREGSLHVAGLTLGCLALALGQHEELDAVAAPTSDRRDAGGRCGSDVHSRSLPPRVDRG